MVDAVDEMLIIQRGKELGYKLSDEQFKTAVDSIKKENKIETEDQFNAALKQENMTMADLRRNFEKQMILSRVEQNEVFGKVGVSEEEARAYYDAHLNEFTTPPSITMREILIGVDRRRQRDERRAGRSGERARRVDSCAHPRRRELRQSRRRSVRRAFESERRLDRAAQHERPVARSAQASSKV